jgi:cellulose synthase/poly-beta-1,6-N-acetylglucosamine synthase-like glycosyltransferase
VEPWRLLGSSDLGLGPNIAVRRSTLSEVGGFDTSLGGVTRSRVGSDLDLLDRVVLAGRIVRYEPAALVWHEHPSTMGELRELRYNAGRSFGSYLLVRYGARRPSRRVVAGYAVRWVGGLILSIPRRLLHRGRVPIPLLAAELWGALNAPLAQLRNRLQDRRVRRTRRTNGS